MSAPQFSVEHTARNVSVVTMNVGGSGWEQWFLLSADRHHDNPQSNNELEKQHLEEAKERGAGIIDAGDFFCAMQGKYDKRKEKGKVRPIHMPGEHNEYRPYFDNLVNEAADFLLPYAENIIVIGQGNHESKILEKHETDLTTRLVEQINTRSRIERNVVSRVQRGGYGGFVKFRFKTTATREEAKTLYYYHGFGGGGGTTKGVGQTAKLSLITPEADIVLSGHTHDSWVVELPRQRLSRTNRIVHDFQIHCRAPGYKDGWGDGYSGFEVQNAHGPKPVGAIWLRFQMSKLKDGIEVDAFKAK